MCWCPLVSISALIGVLAAMLAIQDPQPEGDVRMGSGQMFDHIAPTYDLLNRVMSLGMDMSWRETLVQVRTPSPKTLRSFSGDFPSESPGKTPVCDEDPSEKWF
eukprot:scaffold323_cov232-Pinguiococcus_pyrenoidosus.AAC.2